MKSFAGPFGMAYVPLAESASLAEDNHTLALIHFETETFSGGRNAEFAVSLPQIGGPLVCEYWRSAEAVERSKIGEMDLSRTSQVLFLRLMKPDSSHIDHDAETLYGDLMRVLQDAGYPYLLRVWNYLPRINLSEAGRERYQSFCVGRASALDALGAHDNAQLPAASGLGSMGGGLQVYVIAAREPGVQIENPRQISAFHYPQRYGPRSPSFSRATYKRWEDGEHLYISGTASIVGHDSLHENLESQLGETLANIEAVVGQARRVQGVAMLTPADLSLIKVYLRHAEDASMAEAWLRERLGENMPMVFLQADICRSELLVEIEGAYLGEAK